MNSAAFREDYKVIFCYFIILTTKTQFYCRTTQKLQRTKAVENNALLIKGVTRVISECLCQVTIKKHKKTPLHSDKQRKSPAVTSGERV